MRYLIWSNEHQAWWGPVRWGYTTEISKAGRYSREQAVEIVREARGGMRPGENFPEIAVREDDAFAMLVL